MKILFRSLWGLLRGSFWQVLATSLLIAWLIFLANILIIISYNTSFYTKQEAFARLAQFLPSVLEDFEDYWIENPLPPTLYVLFTDEEEYQIMKSIMVRYNWLIANSADLTDGVSFDDQEKRIQTTINAMNWIQKWSLVLVLIIVCTIIAFLRYALSATIIKFRDQLLVEKLLGAYSWQVVVPFLFYAVLIVILWYLLFLGWALWAASVADTYTLQLFNKSFIRLAIPVEAVWVAVVRELWILIWITLISSYGIVTSLLHRVK